MGITRRHLLAAAAAPALAWASKTSNRIDHRRISAITDEIARTPADAIAFLKKYDLQWAELRDVPGARKYYPSLTEAELKQAAQEFKEAGIKVSFLNASLLKFSLPGTEPVFRNPEAAEARERRLARDQGRFENRHADLEKVIRAAHIFGVPYARIFTFTRVAEPVKIFPRIQEIVGEMAEKAHREGIQLLVENEDSCNVNSCTELAAFIKPLPAKSVGINWDALNGAKFEKPFPDGYQLLPKKRILNVQIKGKTVLAYPEHFDWIPIFEALTRDGYQGQLGLETHIFGEGQVQASHDSMREILRMLETPANAAASPGKRG